jgi:hypothetical protein
MFSCAQVIQDPLCLAHGAPTFHGVTQVEHSS